jgi:hypothetical protein
MSKFISLTTSFDVSHVLVEFLEVELLVIIDKMMLDEISTDKMSFDKILQSKWSRLQKKNE